MQNQSRRAVVNTFILYAKVVISLIISLATTRIVLLSLGVEEFGLYNLIAGLVAMIAFVNIAMTTSTLRYNAYYLNRTEAKDVFNNSVVLHIMLAGIIFVLLEVLGLYFINDLLNVDESKLSLVRIVFQFVVFGCITQIITVPYDSMINAHQDMLAFSVIAIAESILKLTGACLLFIIETDKLIFYSLYISLLPLFTLISKVLYCKNKYPETKKLTLKISNKMQFKEMSFFAFWNMFGAFSNTAKNQGIAMILNVFFGVVVNAAYGISQQINTLCMVLTGSLQKSLNPIILKSAGEGNHSTMIKYALAQCRMSVFLVSIIVLPLYFDLPFILEIWLGQVPEYTIDLCRWLIVLTIFLQMTTGVQVAIQSCGKIRVYQMTMSALILLNIPLSIFFLYLDSNPNVVFQIAILVEFVCIIVRVCFAKKLVSLEVRDYLKNVIVPSCSIGIAFVIAAILNHYIIPESFLSALLKIGSIFILSIGSIWFIGMQSQEKSLVYHLFKRK